MSRSAHDLPPTIDVNDLTPFLMPQTDILPDIPHAPVASMAVAVDATTAALPAPAATAFASAAEAPPPVMTASAASPQAEAITNTASGFSLSLKGVNYVADVYGSFASANSLPSVVATNGNSAAVVADFGIDAANSTVYQDDVDGGYTESDAHIATTVTSAIGDGLSVMVRPIIDFLPSNYETDPNDTNPKNAGYSASEFRAYYNPTDVAGFFASYKAMIVDQATLAQANGAGLFCIGTELDQLTGSAYTSYWTDIITSVRQVFSGKLTYSALWDDDLSPWQYGGSGLSTGTGNIATQISFWNQLDYVGIDNYAPISDLANPTVAQLVKGWTQTPTDSTTLAATGGASLISYYEGIAATLGMKIIFTETGYANSSDADSSPATPGYDEDGNADGATEDPTLQSNLYKAFFQAWQQSGNNALIGAYLWDWEPNASSVGPGTGTNFSVQGLPAQTAVKNGYAACYAGGTRIATEFGETSIETLRPDDRVRTASGALRDVVWLGHRRVDVHHHPRPHDVAPIRVRAHAFAPGQPHRDLVLSPDHSVLVDGTLIPIRHLLNGATILPAGMDRVTYWHVELASHDILLAEGLPAESYLDTGNRGAFANGVAPDIHPDFAADHAGAIWAADSCAPLVTDGALLEVARSRLLERARADTDRAADAGAELLIKGRRISLQDDGRCLHADVPAGPARLRSRSFVPAWMDDTGTDHRRLGLAVAAITLDGQDLPLCGEGWHDPEPGLRWTDGDAALHVPAAGRLEIRLAARGRYWRETSRAA